jgi:hypothetical protein
MTMSETRETKHKDSNDQRSKTLSSDILFHSLNLYQSDISLKLSIFFSRVVLRLPLTHLSRLVCQKTHCSSRSKFAQLSSQSSIEMPVVSKSQCRQSHSRTLLPLFKCERRVEKKPKYPQFDAQDRTSTMCLSSRFPLPVAEVRSQDRTGCLTPSATHSIPHHSTFSPFPIFPFSHFPIPIPSTSHTPLILTLISQLLIEKPSPHSPPSTAHSHSSS